MRFVVDAPDISLRSLKQQVTDIVALICDNILNSFQHNFTKSKFTRTALIQHSEKIILNLNIAFDTLAHSLLA